MYIQGYYGAYAGYGLSTQMQQQLAAEQAAQNRADTTRENTAAVEKDKGAEGLRDLKDIWKELGGKHNVNNMTLESMQTISQTLYNNDKITIHEHTVMTFLLEKDAGEGNQNLFRTDADEEGKRDWIAEFMARLEEHQAKNDEQAAEMDQRILTILERLQAAAKGGLNVQV